MPALLTMMSRLPKASVDCWITASTSFGSETSAPTTRPLPPAPSIFSSTFWAASSRLE